MDCPKCGKNLPDGVQFCHGCGAFFGRTYPSDSPQAMLSRNRVNHNRVRREVPKGFVFFSIVYFAIVLLIVIFDIRDLINLSKIDADAQKMYEMLKSAYKSLGISTADIPDAKIKVPFRIYLQSIAKIVFEIIIAIGFYMLILERKFRKSEND